MRVLTLILMAGVASPLWAQAEIEHCLPRLEELIAALEQLEQSASNDIARASCIAEKRHKIKGLRELTASSAARLPALIDQDDADAIAAERAAIEIACARAEKIAAEAAKCDSDANGRARKRRPAPEPSPPTPPAKSARGPGQCIKQSELARLLLQLMELPRETERSPAEELSRFAIEPLRGWRPDDCVTLDDFVVAVARALNLKVETPHEPVSYLQSLREEGLPVDACLPARREDGEPPVLLETEVRAFLAAGYVVPLPSSRPLLAP